MPVLPDIVATALPTHPRIRRQFELIRHIELGVDARGAQAAMGWDVDLVRRAQALCGVSPPSGTT